MHDVRVVRFYVQDSCIANSHATQNVKTTKDSEQYKYTHHVQKAPDNQVDFCFSLTTELENSNTPVSCRR